ncbi:DMT family transporter [Intrasporangium sp. DVR]|uniref:DMT family transporter n=1 Tax=Intrasporangium sp. DVR TaxID=3127867 RepID=UPI00333F1FAA
MTPSAASATRSSGVDLRGALLVMGAACCYALSVVFAKGAYAMDVEVATLTLWRFAIGAVIFWALVAVRRPARVSRRTVLTCVGLGAVGYAVQALTYFGAVAVMDAGLAALLVYTYPAIIALIGFLTRREPPTRRRMVALTCSGAGMLLLLGLGGFTSVSGVGIGLALTAGVTYAVYTIVASSLPAEADVSLLMAIVATSALGSVALFTMVTGQPFGLEADPVVLGWVLTYVFVGTVLAMLLHQRGITRVGASTGGIISSIEPLVAAAAVALVYGETMTPVQVVGGMVILVGVVVVQLPQRRSRRVAPPRRSAELRPDRTVAHRADVPVGALSGSASS